MTSDAAIQTTSCNIPRRTRPYISALQTWYCPEPDCAVGVLFTHGSDLRAHVKQYHRPLVDFQCDFGECVSILENYDALLEHMQEIHELPRDLTADEEYYLEFSDKQAELEDFWAGYIHPQPLPVTGEQQPSGSTMDVDLDTCIWPAGPCEALDWDALMQDLEEFSLSFARSATHPDNLQANDNMELWASSPVPSSDSPSMSGADEADVMEVIEDDEWCR